MQPYKTRIRQNNDHTEIMHTIHGHLKLRTRNCHAEGFELESYDLNCL